MKGAGEILGQIQAAEAKLLEAIARASEAAGEVDRLERERQAAVERLAATKAEAKAAIARVQELRKEWIETRTGPAELRQEEGR